jgi:hypothetical protein
MDNKTTQKTLTLFFFKLYTSTHIIDITPILQFLEVSINEFTSVGSKLILNSNDDDEVYQEFYHLNILNFNPTKKAEFEFVQEVILSFDSILRFTSLELWNAKSLANRKATASEKLEASLKADDIINTTELITEAISKAKHNIHNKNELQTNLELRMANLEKMLSKQQQQQKQKNSKGVRPEHRSSHTPPAPLLYKSRSHNNKTNPKHIRDPRLDQTHTTKNQHTHKSEYPNQTTHIPKNKYSIERTYPQNLKHVKTRTTENPKYINDKKRKAQVNLNAQELTSDSQSQASQSTVSDLPTHPPQIQIRRKQNRKSLDVKHKEHNVAHKRKKN